MRHLTEKAKQEIITEVLTARENRKQLLLEMKQRQNKGLDFGYFSLAISLLGIPSTLLCSGCSIPWAG